MENKAYEQIIKLLTRKEYCESEIRKKLFDYGFSLEEIEPAVSLAKQRKYLSDERFTECFIRDQVFSLHGLTAILFKLKSKAISKEIIDSTLDKLEIDWNKTAVDYFIFKRYHLTDYKKDQKNKAKIMRNMAARGFSFDSIKYCFNYDYSQVEATFY